MDVIKKRLFYRTALIICCLFCFLSLQRAYAGQQELKVLYPSGLFWKIQKENQADSYLFGTIHISDRRVIKLIDIVQPSLQQSDVFAMEVVLDEAAQQAISEASFFSSEELLQDYIDDLLLDDINLIMNQYYGIEASTVNKMKPWAVMATISSPPPENNKAVLDIELQNLAIELSRPVKALETVEEQLQALAGMKLSDQLWLLNKTVKDFEKNTALWEQMIENYLHRDLQALMQGQQAMMDEHSTVDDRFMKRLLEQRNIKMVQRLMLMMQEQSVFAAVGALHLPGENGLLNLLESAGYTVSPVY